MDFGGFPGPQGVKNWKTRRIATYSYLQGKREEGGARIFIFGKIDSKMGLFWGPPAFENRDFLVILTHFVHLLGLLEKYPGEFHGNFPAVT